jgi:hypothetical protein
MPTVTRRFVGVFFVVFVAPLPAARHHDYAEEVTTVQPTAASPPEPIRCVRHGRRARRDGHPGLRRVRRHTVKAGSPCVAVSLRTSRRALSTTTRRSVRGRLRVAEEREIGRPRATPSSWRRGRHKRLGVCDGERCHRAGRPRARTRAPRRRSRVRRLTVTDALITETGRQVAFAIERKTRRPAPSLDDSRFAEQRFRLVSLRRRLGHVVRGGGRRRG